MSFLHDLCRRSISFASPSPTSPSRPSEIISTTAFCPSTLRDHRRLNSPRQLPMRVPPDQSAIASDTPLIATSTSRWRRYRLMLVSRVPKTKLVTRSRSLVIVCRRSEEHTSELQSLRHLVCRLLLEKKKNVISLNSHVVT